MINQKDSASEGVSEAAPDHIWLRQTHEQDGWQFGYYCNKPQDDAFVEYARVHQPPEQNSEDKNSVSGASDYSTSRIPKDITLTLAEIRAALVAELQRINQYVLWQDQSWCRNENERQMVEDNEAQDREKFADAVLARIGITQLTKTALRGHNPELSQHSPASFTESEFESASVHQPDVQHERDLLAQGIAEAAQKAGIYNGEVPLTGPHLLMLCDDLAEAASHAPDVQAADVEAERDTLRKWMERALREGRHGPMCDRARCVCWKAEARAALASPVQPEVSKEQDNAKS